jgi:HEPN domain-containing protein/phage FluMu protein Com
MMNESITIDCPKCKVRVSVKPSGEIYLGDHFDTVGYFLCKCPTCESPLLGKSFQYLDDYNTHHWEHAERLWPDPDRIELNQAIPERARMDLKDAQKCFSHGIYSAAAVLCGRSLERIVRDKTGEKMIGKGINKLLELGVIDQRLFEWAEALRKERNIAAHASDEDITLENARDILDFTIAIYDYVYTLHDKYQKFMERKNMVEQGT